MCRRTCEGLEAERWCRVSKWSSSSANIGEQYGSESQEKEIANALNVVLGPPGLQRRPHIFFCTLKAVPNGKTELHLRHQPEISGIISRIRGLNKMHKCTEQLDEDKSINLLCKDLYVCVCVSFLRTNMPCRQRHFTGFANYGNHFSHIRIVSVSVGCVASAIVCTIIFHVSKTDNVRLLHCSIFLCSVGVLSLFWCSRKGPRASSGESHCYCRLRRRLLHPPLRYSSWNYLLI